TATPGYCSPRRTMSCLLHTRAWPGFELPGFLLSLLRWSLAAPAALQRCFQFERQQAKQKGAAAYTSPGLAHKCGALLRISPAAWYTLPETLTERLNVPAHLYLQRVMTGHFVRGVRRRGGSSARHQDKRRGCR